MKSEDTILAAIAGFVDTLSFVALFGLFTAHVTGNFVLIGAGMAGFGRGVLLKLIVFPAFIGGVVVSALLVRSLSEKHACQGARLLHAVQAVLMFGYCLAGVWATPVSQPESLSVTVAGVIGAFAMGVQNAHPKLIRRPGVPNTVMTGNVTQAILDVVDMLSADTAESVRATARARFATMMPAIVAFAIGAAAGALGYRYTGFWALLAPACALVALALTTGKHERAATPGHA
ncbi:YoaK family protein [Paraburkholderia kirstenboschensis]|uniref:YoaK family protein n=1 Tax=Paraburkholderia kirstenboschensis TaxID=1245436 RepID=A0ABZ0E8Y5_9BURK|nr:YoaK family protein [Paraburkholderia kirstenboschensis]WOD13666.1 YoaK family protein [Paraburkholderia kirstenboschensis]